MRRRIGWGLSWVRLSLSLAGLSGALLGCQPVPIGSQAEFDNKPKPSPSPLVKGPITGKIHDGRKPKGFAVNDPTAKQPATAKSNPGGKKSPAGADVSQQLADAADKAESAKSLAQSAQTQDDWNLVFDRWKKAIAILKAAPNQSSAVKQKLAEYNSGLNEATRLAAVSLDPSLAPVDPLGGKNSQVFIGGTEPEKKDGKDKGAPKDGAKPAEGGDQPAAASEKPTEAKPEGSPKTN
jgi:hypothetical protein